MDIQVTKKQRLFMDAREDEVLYGGAAGGGKSYVQFIDALVYGTTYPGMKQLILRRSFPELERSLIRVMLELYPQQIYSYKEEYYDQMLGNQRYSINIGGQSYTIDWLTPISMPLMAGVELADHVMRDVSEDDDEDYNAKFNRVVSALSTMVDPVVQDSNVINIVELEKLGYGVGDYYTIKAIADQYKGEKRKDVLRNMGLPYDVRSIFY